MCVEIGICYCHKNVWEKIYTKNVTIKCNSITDDRYAALADLDLELRQQNFKNMGKEISFFSYLILCCAYFFQWRLFFAEETNNVNSKNPFQSSTTNDLFGNKNPFFNGGWSAPPPVPVNPFMVSSF